MSELEDKLSALMGDPALMQQIMQFAQNLEAPQTEPSQKEPESLPFDPAMLQQVSSLATKGNIDKNQKALLQALEPYLTRRRVARLERAMKAAKMASFATSFLGR